jgi:hypothetical protein
MGRYKTDNPDRLRKILASLPIGLARINLSTGSTASGTMSSILASRFDYNEMEQGRGGAY